MNEVQEIANYVAQRLEYWTEVLKKTNDPNETAWTHGQIFEATKILKHIQDEYNINPKEEE